MEGRNQLRLFVVVQTGFAIWMALEPGGHSLFVAYALACLLLLGIVECSRPALHNRFASPFKLSAGDALIGLDANGQIQFSNSEAELLLGFPSAALKQLNFKTLLASEENPNRQRKHQGFAVNRPDRGELQLKTALGNTINVEFVSTPLKGDRADLQILVSLAENSEVLKTQDMLQQASVVFEHTHEGILITDGDGLITQVNPAFTKITGYQPEEVLGQSPRLFSSGEHGEPFYASMWQQLLSEGCWQGEIWNKRKNGQIFPEWLNISLIRDPQGNIEHFVGVFSDISSMKEGERRLQHLATHDHLTQLPNRMLLEDRLNHALARARRNCSQVGVLFMDLDRFKHINDSLGHATGDLVLVECTQRLTRLLRSQDTIARLGGDEFVIVIEDPGPEDALQVVADKVISALSQPFEIAGHQLFISTSVGISRFPKDGDTSEALLKNADCAMYQAKQAGKGRYEYYTPGLLMYAEQSIQMEEELRRALTANELHLVFQPQIDLESSQPIGAEALIRWNHPQFGHIAPAHLIPLAEETGLIHDLGYWVLEQVCATLTTLTHCTESHFKVSINISEQQLQQRDFAQRVKKLINAHQANAYRIEFELREPCLLKDDQVIHANLSALHQFGIRFALDDFGTGFLSLSQLQRLPIESLKIGNEIIATLLDDENQQAIVNAMMALSRCMSLRIVAKGVESDAQLSYLKQAGCHGVQGYYLGEPLTLTGFITTHLRADAGLTAGLPVTDPTVAG